jgi:hypothetical protein
MFTKKFKENSIWYTLGRRNILPEEKWEKWEKRC